ncbi:ABC transporter substrate-binding protein [Clostridiales bacterium COT073_COT-073]|nr:ABC transporter substrate-binding protein [Clostridiales bacterium COT073_COT-073]
MKKITSVLLILILILTLVACAKNDKGQKTDSTPTTDNKTETKKEETPVKEDNSKKEETTAKEETSKNFDIIWVSCSTESEFWQYQEIGMRNAVKDMQEKHGIKINFTTVGPATEAETESYIRAFENAIAAQPSAIISATQVPDSTRSVSKEAMDRGIVVNFTNCGLETLDSNEFSDCYNQFYTTVSADVGDLAGKIMIEKLNEAGIPLEGIIAMEFSNVNPSLQPRMDNFKAYVEANSKIKVLDTLYNNNDLEQAQADIENQIATHGDKLIGIYGANNISGDGIALAVENAGIKDKVITIGVDSDPIEIAALEAGTLDCIIVQDAYGQGYAALENAVLTLIDGKNPEKEQKVVMPPVAVTTENMKEEKYAALLNPKLLEK